MIQIITIIMIHIPGLNGCINMNGLQIIENVTLNVTMIAAVIIM